MHIQMSEVYQAFLYSFFCTTIIIEAIRLQIIKTEMISLGEYHVSKSGNDKSAKPNPVIPFIKLEMMIINIIQKFSMGYRVKKNNEPIAITAHRLIPSAKLFTPDFLISLTVIFEPIRNKAMTIPRLPSQLKCS